MPPSLRLRAMSRTARRLPSLPRGSLEVRREVLTAPWSLRPTFLHGETAQALLPAGSQGGHPPYGPWRACCRCGEPIGDPPHHELQTFRGIFAEDANICSLGMTFDRCRHCGLPHHDLAVDPGQTDCHDLPCTGLGWAATPRASRSIPRILPRTTTGRWAGQDGRLLQTLDL